MLGLGNVGLCDDAVRWSLISAGVCELAISAMSNSDSDIKLASVLLLHNLAVGGVRVLEAVRLKLPILSLEALAEDAGETGELALRVIALLRDLE